MAILLLLFRFGYFTSLILSSKLSLLATKQDAHLRRGYWWHLDWEMWKFNSAVYYVYCPEIEIIDAFRGHNLTIDDTLQQQLLAEWTKLVKFSLKPSGLTTAYSSRRSSLYQEYSVSWATLGLLLSGWIIMAIIAHIMYQWQIKLLKRYF